MDRIQLLDIVRRWGHSTTDAVLDPKSQYFILKEIEGLIAYRLESGCAVVFGDPVASDSDIKVLTTAFHQFCQQKNYKIIYIAVSDNFAAYCVDHSLCRTRIQFGKELYLDPHDDPRKKTGTDASLVRRKVRHAEKEGVHVNEYLEKNREIEEQIEHIGKEWLKKRRGIQIHISHLHLFEDCKGKRWFYAQVNNNIVGIVTLNQLQAYQGWLLNHLMLGTHAPHGTPELLVISAIEALANEGYHFVTFGAQISDSLESIEGIYGIGRWGTALIFKCICRLFQLANVRKFWEKFHPQAKPSFLLFSEGVGFRELKGLLQAVNVNL